MRLDALRTRRKGFSLLELLFVVVLMGILSVLGYYVLVRPGHARNLAAGTSEILDQLRELRASAMRENRVKVVQVVEGVSGEAGMIRSVDGFNNRCNVPSGGFDQNLVFGEDIPNHDSVIYDITGGNRAFTVCFMPDGRILDPATLGPAPANITGGVDGESYIEMRSINCQRGGGCRPSEAATVIGLSYVGTIEVMPTNFELP